MFNIITNNIKYVVNNIAPYVNDKINEGASWIQNNSNPLRVKSVLSIIGAIGLKMVYSEHQVLENVSPLVTGVALMSIAALGAIGYSLKVNYIKIVINSIPNIHQMPKEQRNNLEASIQNLFQNLNDNDQRKVTSFILTLPTSDREEVIKHTKDVITENMGELERMAIINTVKMIPASDREEVIKHTKDVITENNDQYDNSKCDIINPYGEVNIESLVSTATIKDLEHQYGKNIIQWRKRRYDLTLQQITKNVVISDEDKITIRQTQTLQLEKDISGAQKAVKKLLNFVETYPIEREEKDKSLRDLSRTDYCKNKHHEFQKLLREACKEVDRVSRSNQEILLFKVWQKVLNQYSEALFASVEIYPFAKDVMYSVLDGAIQQGSKITKEITKSILNRATVYGRSTIVTSYSNTWNTNETLNNQFTLLTKKNRPTGYLNQKLCQGGFAENFWRDMKGHDVVSSLSNFDPLQYNLPYRLYTVTINGRSVNMIRMPSPTTGETLGCNSTIAPEFKQYLRALKDKGHKHLYINLQKLNKNEGKRSTALESLSAEFQGTFNYVRLPNNGDFYDQNYGPESSDSSKFQKELADRVLGGNTENLTAATGTNDRFVIPSEWRGDPNFITGINRIIQESFDELYDNKPSLSREERQNLIEFFYGKLSLYLMEYSKTDNVNISCKDAKDRAGKVNAILLKQLQIYGGYQELLRSSWDSEEALSQLYFAVHAPSILAFRVPMNKDTRYKQTLEAITPDVIIRMRGKQQYSLPQFAKENDRISQQLTFKQK